MADVVHHFRGFDVEGAVSRHGELFSCVVTSPLLFVFQSDPTLAAVQFHGLRRPSVEGKRRWKNYADTLARAIGKHNGVGHTFPGKVDVRFFINRNIIEVGHFSAYAS